MPLALGLAGYAFIRHRRTKRAVREVTPDDFAIDPLDSVQSFEKISDLEIATLDVDALSAEDILAAEDLAVLEVDDPSMRRDADDLDGAHTPLALDREHLDDDRAFKEGQNWVEALETSAIEYGPEPERELDDLVDGEDVLDPPGASARRDRPVADNGSGGRRGL
jgi:hypothetical protein